MFSRKVLHIAICVFFCISNARSMRKTTLYQDEHFKVVEMDIFRLLIPRVSHNDNLAHGYISLKQPKHIQQDYFQMILGALLLEPEPKRILLLGLGIGVLPRTFNEIFPASHIDVVEIDPNVLEVARKFFFFHTSENLHVHIDDGFNFVMQLPDNASYDMIVLDAFIDVTEECCAPDSFLTDHFIEKVNQRLSPNGVLVINTLPPLCSKHEHERELYKKVFGTIFYTSIEGLNTIILAKKGRMPTSNQIKERVIYWNEVFSAYNVDSTWVLNAFGQFKSKQHTNYDLKSSDLYSRIFLNNVCLL